jgi:hypothetical protein
MVMSILNGIKFVGNFMAECLEDLLRILRFRGKITTRRKEEKYGFVGWKELLKFSTWNKCIWKIGFMLNLGAVLLIFFYNRH